MQLEKDLRTQVELMRKQKKERKQELKRLQEQDQELCEVLCTPRYDINSDSVPTLEELNQFRHHVAALRETKVHCLRPYFLKVSVTFLLVSYSHFVL